MTGQPLDAVPMWLLYPLTVLAMLATIGVTTVSVFRRPAVSVLSTGDELVPPESEAGPGQPAIRGDEHYALSILRKGFGDLEKTACTCHSARPPLGPKGRFRPSRTLIRR